jgi:hypothetical protein
MDTTLWSTYVGGGSVMQVTNQVTGMSYLLGQTVVAVGDQAKITPPNGVVVTSDAVTFPYYSNFITIGLPYQTTIQPMNPVIGNPQATSKGKKQKFSRVTLSLYEAIGGQVGTDVNHLHDIQYEPQDALFTGNLTRDLDADWEDEDTILIVHGEPFPFTLRSVVPRLSVAEEG